MSACQPPAFAGVLLLGKLEEAERFPPPSPKDKKGPGKLSWVLCSFQSWRAKNDPCVGYSCLPWDAEKGL